MNNRAKTAQKRTLADIRKRFAVSKIYSLFAYFWGFNWAVVHSIFEKYIAPFSKDYSGRVLSSKRVFPVERLYNVNLQVLRQDLYLTARHSF